MRSANVILLTVALLCPLAADAATRRADVAATHVGGSGLHPISGNGRRVAFSTRVGNPSEGDDEIFLWDREGGYLQLTDELSKPGTNVVSALAADHDGDVVAVIASGDLSDSGATTDELYRWSFTEGFERLTFTAGTTPEISRTTVAIGADGRRIAFASRADHTGGNPGGELQIFLWDESVGIRQVTTGFPCGSGGGNFLIDLSGDGRRILFHSRCRFGRTNPDLGTGLFLWDEVSGVRELTDIDEPIAVLATLDHDGNRAAVFSLDDISRRGIRGPVLYRWIDGRGFEPLRKEVFPVTPSIDAAGDRIAYVASNGQGGRVNPEGNTEIFLWQDGLANVAALTDSGHAGSIGNTEPHLAADGTRLSMLARREFDAPGDRRSGHYLLDVLTLQPRQPNLLDNGGFDSGLRGWQASGTATFSADDGRQDPASGSVLQLNDHPDGGAGVSSIDQCVKVTPSTRYLLSSLLRVVPGDRAGSAYVRVELYPGEACAGGLETERVVAASPRSDGAWTAAFGRFDTGPATRTARVRLFAGKDDAGGALEAGFDDLVLRPENPSSIFP